MSLNMELRPCKRLTMAVEEEEERESKQKEGEESRLSGVIDQILVEILIRLGSSKSAKRCKAVCKRWKSIISTRYFIAQFITHYRNKTTRKAPNSFTLAFQWNMVIVPKSISMSDSINPLRAISNHPMMFNQSPNNNKTSTSSSYFNVHSLNLDFLPLQVLPNVQKPESLHLEASCHDLLLLSYYGIHYYVVNLLTRHWTLLPPAPSSTHRGGSFFKSGLLCDYYYNHHSNSNNNFNSDYDCTSSSYNLRFKVIRVPIHSSFWIEVEDTFRIPATFGSESPEFIVHVFCSTSKQWTQYNVDWYPFRLTHYLRHTPIVSHNGMLHWLNGGSLVSLNPFEVVLDDDDRVRLNRTLDFPEDVPQGLLVPGAGRLGTGIRVTLLGFGVSRVHLRVITEHSGEERALLVWELDERESRLGAGLWRLAHKVQLYELPLKERVRKKCIKFLAFHPHDGDVLFVQIANSIYRINLRTKTCKSLQQLEPYRTNCWLTTNAVPPLLHQWFPTPLTSPVPDSPPAVTFLQQS